MQLDHLGKIGGDHIGPRLQERCGAFRRVGELVLFGIYGIAVDHTCDDHHKQEEADKNNDPEGVVNAIHKGIQYASHLLCIVTGKSKDSWWIPYEIGFAQANGVKTSSIKIKQAEYLPTYLRVDNSPVFLTIVELDEYLSKNGPYGGLFSKMVAGASNEETYLYFEK